MITRFGTRLYPLQLPLVARKDIRDNWEANTEEFTQTIAGLLKEQYQLEVFTTRAIRIQYLDALTSQVDFKQLYAHAAAADASWAKVNPGACAKAYFESFIDYLKRFTDDVSGPLILDSDCYNALQGEYTEAVDAFNDLISTRKIILECDNSVTYSGCSVKSGAYEVRVFVVLESCTLISIHADQLQSAERRFQCLIRLRGVRSSL